MRIYFHLQTPTSEKGIAVWEHAEYIPPANSIVSLPRENSGLTFHVRVKDIQCSDEKTVHVIVREED